MLELRNRVSSEDNAAEVCNSGNFCLFALLSHLGIDLTFLLRKLSLFELCSSVESWGLYMLTWDGAVLHAFYMQTTGKRRECKQANKSINRGWRKERRKYGN